MNANAHGRYIVLLDEDSCPRPGAIARMIMHFEQDARLGAAVFTVTQSCGSRQYPRFPNIIARCGTGIRRRAIDHIGGLPNHFLKEHDIYDLSQRLLTAGWDICPFDDLHVTRARTEADSPCHATIERHICDDIQVLARHFPSQWIMPFAKDWLRRQRIAATSTGNELSYYRGVAAGLMRSLWPMGRRAMPQPIFEKIVRIDEIQRQMFQAKYKHQLKNILLIDLTDNTLPFYLAAQKCDLKIVGIADRETGGHRRRYRGIPLLNDAAARDLKYDAAILTALSPLQAAERRESWRLLDTRPVLDLFEHEAPYGFTSSVPERSQSRRTVARTA